MNDTHYYDGKIKSLYRRMVYIDDNELDNSLTFNQCMNELFSDLNRLSDNDIDKISCKNTLFLFENDKDNNYDNINDIHLEDILVRTWKFIKHYDDDMKIVFFEQLGDIYNGPCAQGRVTRIFQFYQIHINNKDSIYQICKK